MAEHNEVGRLGEEVAVDFLEQKGLKILARNWRFRKAELDVVATDGQFLIVVEVKSRKDEYFGAPEEAVGERKQRLLIDATEAFLLAHEIDLECRFDILSVIFDEDPPRIRHIEAAFYPTLGDD